MLMLRPIWVLVPQAVASMVSYLSLANPGMLPIIIKPRTSRPGMAILTVFDSLDMLLSSCSLTRTFYGPDIVLPLEKPHNIRLCGRPLRNDFDCDYSPGGDRLPTVACDSLGSASWLCRSSARGPRWRKLLRDGSRTSQAPSWW